MRPPQSLLAPRNPVVRARQDTGNFAGPPPPATFLKRTFLIFAPFCDQGLGVQARAYIHWLHQLHFRACVFACAPSKTSGPQAPAAMQAAQAEWQPGADVTVHYSPHNREAQPWQPLVQFAREQGVTDALMLETAHLNIFRLAAALYKHNSARVWAVPNIEMVRRDELCQRRLYDSEVFSGILCHNEYAVEVLRFFRAPLDERIKLLPFALPAAEAPPLEVRYSEPYDGYGPIRFLLVGGMNAVARKHADRVARVFHQLYHRPDEPTLTVLSQRVEPRLQAVARQAPNVAVVERHFSGQQILDAYAKHHVVLLLSRAEGIGIGVYEALRAGCAVVTLKHRMFTEAVDPRLNGWVVPCQEEPGKAGAAQVGNADPVVRTYTFRDDDLRAALQHISSHPGDVQARQRLARLLSARVFAPERVTRAWDTALRINRATGAALHDAAAQQRGLQAFADAYDTLSTAA